MDNAELHTIEYINKNDDAQNNVKTTSSNQSLHASFAVDVNLRLNESESDGDDETTEKIKVTKIKQNNDVQIKFYEMKLNDAVECIEKMEATKLEKIPTNYTELHHSLENKIENLRKGLEIIENDFKNITKEKEDIGGKIKERKDEQKHFELKLSECKTFAQFIKSKTDDIVGNIELHIKNIEILEDCLIFTMFGKKNVGDIKEILNVVRESKYTCKQFHLDSRILQNEEIFIKTNFFDSEFLQKICLNENEFVHKTVKKLIETHDLQFNLNKYLHYSVIIFDDLFKDLHSLQQDTDLERLQSFQDTFYRNYKTAIVEIKEKMDKLHDCIAELRVQYDFLNENKKSIGSVISKILKEWCRCLLDADRFYKIKIELLKERYELIKSFFNCKYFESDKLDDNMQQANMLTTDINEIKFKFHLAAKLFDGYMFEFGKVEADYSNLVQQLESILKSKNKTVLQNYQNIQGNLKNLMNFENKIDGYRKELKDILNIFTDLDCLILDLKASRKYENLKDDFGFYLKKFQQVLEELKRLTSNL
jgi:hypothetical protein